MIIELFKIIIELLFNDFLKRNKHFLDDILFSARSILYDSVERELAEVNTVCSVIQYQLAHCPAHRRSLLETMAAEAVGEDQVGDDRMGSDDGILVERVVLVITSPCTLNLNRSIEDLEMTS